MRKIQKSDKAEVISKVEAANKGLHFDKHGNVPFYDLIDEAFAAGDIMKHVQYELNYHMKHATRCLKLAMDFDNATAEQLEEATDGWIMDNTVEDLMTMEKYFFEKYLFYQFLSTLLIEIANS